MYRLIFSFILFFNLLFASNLESLLEEYEDTSNNSLQTLNEKMGHARIYSQKDLKLMQYDRLSDILKELPINNLNKSVFGTNTLSLTGTKSETSGYFRLFINDHEVSSAHTQSPFLGWFELPVSLIDHIEIYYGEGSFTLGSETGVEFIRVYTKKAAKENGSNFKTTVSSKSSNSQEFSHSSLLENGWSYLLYFANQNDFFQRSYKNQKLRNDLSQQYLYLDLENNTNRINLGFTKLQKENFQSLSIDSVSDDGQISYDNLFFNYKGSFLKDNSLKISLGFDLQNRAYNEINKEGILVSSLPSSYNGSIKTSQEDIQLKKTNILISKDFKYKNNNLFTAINIKNKKYKVKSRSINATNIGKLNNFDEETSYSLIFEDEYKVLDNLYLIGNIKIDRYNRSGYMKDTTENLYRVGSIYLPTKNLGFKTFYTISHIPPSFYNTDFAFIAKPNLDSQKYKYFTTETAYTYGDSRVSIEYFNVHIDDYIYFAQPIGFININDHTIKTDGIILDYIYNIDNNSKFELNYFASQLTEVKSGYTQGGYVKYMKSYGKFSYFSSLLYRDGYEYLNLNLKDSYNLNLGATYNATKNLSFSIKGNNLLNKSTQSIFSDKTTSINTPTLYTLDDHDRTISFSLNWRF